MFIFFSYSSAPCPSYSVVFEHDRVWNSGVKVWRNRGPLSDKTFSAYLKHCALKWLGISGTCAGYTRRTANSSPGPSKTQHIHISERQTLCDLTSVNQWISEGFVFTDVVILSYYVTQCLEHVVIQFDLWPKNITFLVNVYSTFKSGQRFLFFVNFVNIDKKGLVHIFRKSSLLVEPPLPVTYEINSWLSQVGGGKRCISCF